MRIGIYLGYGPGTVFGSEGLGRYLGGLIKGFTEEESEVVIVMPIWLKDSVDELFQEFDILCDNIEFRISNKVPFAWKIYNLLIQKKKGKKKKSILPKMLKLRDYIENIMFTTTSLLLIIVILLLVFIACCIAVIPLVFICVIGILRKIFKKVFKVAQNATNNKNDEKIGIKQIIKSRIKNNYIVLLSAVRKILVDEANKEAVDIWFVPALFWKETCNLKGIRVNVVPDMVTEKYAFDFSEDKAAIENIDNCREVIRRGKYFITYSEYVNRFTLQNEFHKFYGRSIPITYTDLSRWIELNKAEFNIPKIEDATLRYAKILLSDLVPINTKDRNYYRNYSLSDVEYVFYPSQVRPHKNMETLIRAVHYLIKYRERNLKLVLTCNNAFFSDRIKDFIKESGMENNILCFHGVTAQQLAALYKCAKLVVNPSLYEGGFVVFTLGEGMSVGTPSVMGNMPQNMDVINDYPIIRDEAIFDSNDYIDMAKTIEWGLDNRDKLYRDELPLYEAYSKRDNRSVAHEYIEYFKYVLECEKKAI